MTDSDACHVPACPSLVQEQRDVSHCCCYWNHSCAALALDPWPLCTLVYWTNSPCIESMNWTYTIAQPEQWYEASVCPCRWARMQTARCEDKMQSALPYCKVATSAGAAPSLTRPKWVSGLPVRLTNAALAATSLFLRGPVLSVLSVLSVLCPEQPALSAY